MSRNSRTSKARIIDDIEIIPISDSEWRISDATKDESNGLALLGFVQKLGADFEVTTLGNPGKRKRLSSFTAAVDSLSPRREIGLEETDR